MQKLSSDIVQTQAGVEFKFTFSLGRTMPEMYADNGRSLCRIVGLTSIDLYRFNISGSRNSIGKQAVV